MLLTLCVSSLRPLIHHPDEPLALHDVPAFARDSLGLNGLSLSTDLLKGATRSDLEALRDRADKVACSCLLLEQPEPLPFASADPARAQSAIERAQRVLRAAQILGCNSAAVRIEPEDDPLATDLAIERLRKTVDFAERIEVNLLLAPHAGLTNQPEQVTDLLKRIGGFRIGTLPDFAAAAEAPDPVVYLRRLTPYASVVLASTMAFDSMDAPPEDESLEVEDLLIESVPVHTTYELAPMVEAVISVGFDITLSINYRGEGNPVLGILASRAALEAAIENAHEGE
ncbi:MAG: sugar phosphate isomerase/epimerase [Leptolyngbya sp. PLA3]|nr:MAG: sugar phosphate isomerase/epimerase [Cyanobacteria bacterium CYA]MCE7968512.1 sugar phosphate isomerase/epimerase [Leptolyngbya sp. PL-A3]